MESILLNLEKKILKIKQKQKQTSKIRKRKYFKGKSFANVNKVFKKEKKYTK